MLAAIFLLSIFLNGNFLIKRFFDKRIMFSDSFLVGSVYCVSFIYILFFLLRNLSLSLGFYFLLSAIVYMKEYTGKIELNASFVKDLLIFASAVFIAFLLFEKSFSYSGSNFLIQSNLYQDMGAHIPMIRYFSGGLNFIPEVPFFAGKNLFYHFMFDFYTGILEFLGMRIDVAFNLLSSLSLISLFYVIVSLSKFLFKNSLVGILAYVLLIFNGDLSFLNLLSKYGATFQGLIGIYHHNIYPTGNIFGLLINYNFLNINVFLNQRQLIFGLLYVFYIIYVFLSNKITKRQVIFLGLLIGLMPFWHISALISVYLIFVALFVLFSEYRKSIVLIILISLIFVLPQIYLIKLHSLNQIVLNVGFLVSKNLTIKSFFSFWIWNLGFTIPIAIFAFIKSNSFQKKIFLCFLTLFIVPNLFQFSADLFDNHKFFNVWIVIVNIFAGYGLYVLFKKGPLFRSLSIVLFCLMTASGLLHLLVVKNDIYVKIADPKDYKFVRYIGKSDIYLTNGEIYDPASLAGLRIYLGRAQYVYLYGGDPSGRMILKQKILNGKFDLNVKQTLQKDEIKYIIIYKDQEIPNLVKVNNHKLSKNYKKIYEDNFAIIFKI